MSDTRVIGVDVGGSGVKAALGDVKRGGLASLRPPIDTPPPAAPKLVGAPVSRPGVRPPHASTTSMLMRSARVLARTQRVAPSWVSSRPFFTGFAIAEINIWPSAET